MNAFPHEFDLARATALPPLGDEPAQALDTLALAERWEALHEAADAVAKLAQLGHETPPPAVAELPALATLASPTRRAMVEDGIGDLSAVMQTGLTALLAVVDRGGDATAAAVTLWREFHAGRKAICALAQSGEFAA